MTKLYLAGPMSGYPLFNHEAFAVGAAELRRCGYEVFSPAEHDVELGIELSPTGDNANVDLRKVLGDDLAWIAAHAEGIALLDGWVKSKGVRAEVSLALALSIPVAPCDIWALPAGSEVGRAERLEFWTRACAAALDGTLKTAVPGLVFA